MAVKIISTGPVRSEMVARGTIIDYLTPTEERDLIAIGRAAEHVEVEDKPKLGGKKK